MMKKQIAIVGFMLAAALPDAWRGITAQAEEDFFRQSVAPLIETRCLRCHGENAEGGFSLATAAKLAMGGDSGPALAPGKPEESLLIQMISGEKPEMPKGGKSLSADEVAVLRR